MNVIEAIRTKRAVRKYRDEPLSEDVVRGILHAGRRAQSAKNDQPWHFLAIRERANLEALAAIGSNIAYIADAALCVALVTAPPSSRKTILFDAGQAAACMQLAAWELGVVSCLGTVSGKPSRPVPCSAFRATCRSTCWWRSATRDPKTPRRGRAGKGAEGIWTTSCRWERW